MSRLIDTAAECTIGQFMKCMFERKFQTLVVDGLYSDDECEVAFKGIYSEFIDISKLGETAEYELSQSIYYLQGRIHHIEMLISLERESIELIGVPFKPAFDSFKKYSYKLEWDDENSDKESFLVKLSTIENMDKRFKIQLEEKKAEMAKMQSAKESGTETSDSEKRKGFVKSLINLQRSGFKIDREKTFVDEFALMICEQNESNLNNKN